MNILADLIMLANKSHAPSMKGVSSMMLEQLTNKLIVNSTLKRSKLRRFRQNQNTINLMCRDNEYKYINGVLIHQNHSEVDSGTVVQYY